MISMWSTEARPERTGAAAAGEMVASPAARIALGIAAFVVATALSAYVVVPWTPVPMTLQPLFVILAGALLGPWAGAAAMASYVAVGAAGAPVFSAGHAGLAWLMGPTGGYLLAYPAAAFVVGIVAGDADTTRASLAGKARLLGALVAGVAVLYVGGVSQLWMLTRQDPATLLAVGVTPFLLGDLTKILIAFFVALGARRTRTTGSPGSL